MKTEIAELMAPNLLKLPPKMAKQFHPHDRFMIWIVSDTVYLKRLTPSTVTDIVAKVPDNNPLSITEINELVHQARREKKVTE